MITESSLENCRFSGLSITNDLEIDSPEALTKGSKFRSDLDSRPGRYSLFQDEPNLCLGASPVMRGAHLESAMGLFGKIANGDSRHEVHSSII